MLITRIADDFVFTAISLLKSDKSTSCLVLILTLIISSVCKYNEKRKIAGRKSLIRLCSTSKPSFFLADLRAKESTRRVQQCR